MRNDPTPPIQIITDELTVILQRCNAPKTTATNPEAVHRQAAGIVTQLTRGGYIIRRGRSQSEAA